jgi:hypothetical protein
MKEMSWCGVRIKLLYNSKVHQILGASFRNLEGCVECVVCQTIL